ncbi:MAG: TolC family protein [Treponema sp.]|jgi:outer membrane protein TolC|nr:TolC family protein [Treponema sp.]
MRFFSRPVISALFLVSAAALHAQAGDPASVSGENYRRSLSFAAAMDMATASSAELRNAYASQGLKDRAWLLGIRAYLPRLGLNISENDRLQQLGPDSFLKNYGISLDQLLWDGGRTSMSRKLERLDLNLSQSRLGRMASDIAESALSAYRNVLLSREVLAIRETALQSLMEQRRILAEETALGLALPMDLSEADLSLAGARLEIHSLRSDLVEMEKQFAELLGLDSLPVLAETVDINRELILPSASAAGSLAEQRNPELAESRFSITKKEGELRYVSRSWIPAFRITGSFGLNGQTYPLTHHTWSLGLSVEFSSPWFQNSFGIQAGWEPPYDKSAQFQNSLTPLPDPAAGLNKSQARLALALEKEKYRITFERAGRSARRGVEKCLLADQKRRLAVEAISLAAERYHVEEVRLSLGQITRLDLMEAFIEYSQKEIAAVETAITVLEAEQELERILDLRPGELTAFAAAGNKSIDDFVLSHNRSEL